MYIIFCPLQYQFASIRHHEGMPTTLPVLNREKRLSQCRLLGDMAHWMLGSYLKFWFKGLIRKSPMLEPIEGKGQQILERTFRRRSGTFPRADHCRLKEGLSEHINKICHDPFIVFIQFRLQIHQMAGCLFVIALLHRNRACSPHSPESLFDKTGTL